MTKVGGIALSARLKCQTPEGQQCRCPTAEGMRERRAGFHSIPPVGTSRSGRVPRVRGRGKNIPLGVLTRQSAGGFRSGTAVGTTALGPVVNVPGRGRVSVLILPAPVCPGARLRTPRHSGKRCGSGPFLAIPPPGAFQRDHDPGRQGQRCEQHQTTDSYPKPSGWARRSAQRAAQRSSGQHCDHNEKPERALSRVVD